MHSYLEACYIATISVTAMINNLAWETLQHRKQQAKPEMMYHDTVHSMVALPLSSCTHFQSDVYPDKVPSLLIIHTDTKKPGY